MAEIITLAGETLLTQKHSAGSPLKITTFVLADIPGQDPSAVISRDRGLPDPGQIVYQAPVTRSAYINPNQVVYSLQMGSDLGPFRFNSLYLVSEEGTVIAIATLPDTTKLANDPAQQLRGQNMTRNFSLCFDGAQAITQINVDAASWQLDFSTQLQGIESDIAALTARLDQHEQAADPHPQYQQRSELVGTIAAFPASAAPVGWLKLNGAELSRTAYADLWAFAHGPTNLLVDQAAKDANPTRYQGHFSTGDGSTTFKLPDLRGEFLRVWDDGLGVDLSRNIGSAQSDELRAHDHNGKGMLGLDNTTGNTALRSQGGAGGTPLESVVAPFGGNETRPRNVALLYCIKY